MKITLFIVFTFPYLARQCKLLRAHTYDVESQYHRWCDENTSLQQRQKSFLYIFNQHFDSNTCINEIQLLLLLSTVQSLFFDGWLLFSLAVVILQICFFSRTPAQ